MHVVPAAFSNMPPHAFLCNFGIACRRVALYRHMMCCKQGAQLNTNISFLNLTNSLQKALAQRGTRKL
jgi:hypothetical protein